MKDDKRLRRKVRNSYIVSTVSIALVLFLLGSVGYLMVAALKVADTLQESIAITVELKRETTPERRDAIEKRLAAEDLVATIAYVPKEAKLEDKEFRKMFDSAFEEILEENPLLDSFELTLTPASADKELLAEFIAAAERIEGGPRVVSGAHGRTAARHGGKNPAGAAALRRRAAADLAHSGQQHDPAGDLFETLPDQHDETRRRDQVVHHAPVPREQRHAGHPLRSHRLGAVRRGGLWGSTKPCPNC